LASEDAAPPEPLDGEPPEDAPAEDPDEEDELEPVDDEATGIGIGFPYSSTGGVLA
jgi:hypothetical protein